MSYTDFHLFDKNASTIIFLSKLFIQMDLGTRIPTFEELSKDIGVARGTIQNSLKKLQEVRAIDINPRGHMGSYLVSKNTKILIQMADIRQLLGAMSLPYSKTYEGLATGLITTLHNEYEIPVSMAYMRDAVIRLDAMIKGSYDFVILSKGSADTAIKLGKPVVKVIDFGPKTYLSAHVLLFSNQKSKEIVDGMRVGLAKDAHEQNRWTKKLCRGKKVNYVTLDYSKIIPALKQKEIDATVWNKDEVNDALIQMNTKPIQSNGEDTSAVLMVNKYRPELIKLFREIIDIEEVKRIQQEVILETISPQY
ncbi:GntR family transcriptional regulator YhfZ [Anaerorhabdus furcosa]|uniref:Helix-turn-helix domain-containing protein n=1 Tax=Anaerorhabdus furcosa TaxID=118967 RepID=A0A1T4MVK8_9FIRM|nr:GntR family transcriptional regulator YhfZ [Anaerorhabdus furcosa]SJZ71042.1 Helix-turn-helix domain-containing protein [Anaerorhabdus furcosa]